MKKNDIVTVNITDISFDGQGIGRTGEGFVVFVKNALIGETVLVHILKVLKNTAYGKIKEIIEKSPDRTEPVCVVFSKCGGCAYMHTAYENELKLKTKSVKNALMSVAGLDCKVNEALGNTEYGYRNKMLVPLAKTKEGKVCAGFYRRNSHDVIPMENCSISHNDFPVLIKAVTVFCEKYNIEPYNEMTKKGVIRHVFIRRGNYSGEIMAGVVTKTEKMPYKEEFVSALKSTGLNVVSIIQNINKKDTNVILGEKTVLLDGKPYIEDYMLGNKFFISCQAFYQVNTQMAELLYEKAISYINDGVETVFDLYCGAGTITLALAKKAKKVFGIENCEPAVLNARENAKENKIENVEFICGQAETEIKKLLDDGIKPDAVVLDPPRSGCDKKLIQSLMETLPPKIIYISCNPSTMARDIKELLQYYKVEFVQPVDLFPKTHHCEVICALYR